MVFRKLEHVCVKARLSMRHNHMPFIFQVKIGFKKVKIGFKKVKCTNAHLIHL